MHFEGEQAGLALFSGQHYKANAFGAASNGGSRRQFVFRTFCQATPYVMIVPLTSRYYWEAGLNIPWS